MTIEKNKDNTQTKAIRVSNQIEVKSEYDKKPTSKWINNEGNEVDKVFGFNENAEQVNGRAAMFGFLMLIITETVFGGRPVTATIFGLG